MKTHRDTGTDALASVPASTDTVSAGASSTYVSMSAQERIRRLARLHSECERMSKLTAGMLHYAIEAGELLERQQDILQQAFPQWLENNRRYLGFGELQAYCYMNIAHYRAEVLATLVADMERVAGVPPIGIPFSGIPPDGIPPTDTTAHDEQRKESGILQSNTGVTSNHPTDSHIGSVLPDSLVKTTTSCKTCAVHGDPVGRFIQQKQQQGVSSVIILCRVLKLYYPDEGS